MAQNLAITQAVINQEYELLDGGVVRELSVELSDGRRGTIAVGERQVDGPKENARQVWVETDPWGKRLHHFEVFMAPAEPTPKRQMHGRTIKSLRRLAAIAKLIHTHPEVLRPTGSYIGAFYELTSADRQERKRIDRENRAWRVLRVAELDRQRVIAHLQCDWPRRRLAADPEPEQERRDYVIVIGHNWGDLEIHDHQLGRTATRRIDDKQAAELREALFSKHWKLAAKLVDIEGGLWSADDARSLFKHLVGDRHVRRQFERPSWTREDQSGIDRPVCLAEVVATHETFPNYRSDRPGRILLAKITQPRTNKLLGWMGMLHQCRHGIWSLVDASNSDRAVYCPVAPDAEEYAEQIAWHARRLWEVPRQDYEATDEMVGRRAFQRSVDEDLQARANDDRLRRIFTMLSWAETADTGVVMRLRASWTKLDPLVEGPRPTEYVVVLSTDGTTATTRGPNGQTAALYDGDKGGEQKFNFLDSFAAVRVADTPGDVAEDARFNLNFSLRTGELGFVSEVEADAVYGMLANGPRHETTERDFWACLGRKRHEVTEELLREALALPCVSHPPVAEVSDVRPLAVQTAASEPLPKRGRGRPRGGAPAQTSAERARAWRERQAATNPRPKGKPGRKPRGDRAMTDAERARAYRARKNSASSPA